MLEKYLSTDPSRDFSTVSSFSLIRKPSTQLKKSQSANPIPKFKAKQKNSQNPIQKNTKIFFGGGLGDEPPKRSKKDPSPVVVVKLVPPQPLLRLIAHGNACDAR